MKATLLLLAAFMAFAFSQLVLPIDFAASAPFCYDHHVGGGSWNDKTIGKSLDAVESLEGGDFACGDVATFFTRVQMAPLDRNENEWKAAGGKTTVQIHVTFLGDTTGQSGVAFGYVVNYWLNNGTSSVNGDRNTFPTEGGTNQCNGVGRDSGVKLDGDETVSMTYHKIEGAALFNPKSVLAVKFLVTNLEPSEIAIVVFNVRLMCSGADATGNLQGDIAGLSWGSVNDAGIFNQDSSRSTGGQTVPLISVGDVQPCVLDEAPLTGMDFQANLVITGSGANSYLSSGASVTGRFYYCWSTGQYSFQTGSGPSLRTRTRSYDYGCTIQHLSDNDYTYSSCGCELVQQFPTSAQPQLFWDSRGGYYDPTKTVNEGTVTHYYAFPTSSLTTGVTELWLSNTSPFYPTKIKWADGTIFTFSNQQPLDCKSLTTQALFAPPTSCNNPTCGRPVDVMLVVQLSSDTSLADQQASRLLATNLVSNYFNFGPTAIQFGLVTFNNAPKLVLKPDPNEQTVLNAINSPNGISCPPNNVCSGTSSPASAILLAAQALVDPGRPAPDTATKVIVLILESFTDTSAAGVAAIRDAVNRAYTQYGVFVLAVPYTTQNLQTDLFNLATNQDPRNLLQRYYLTNGGRVIGGAAMDSPPTDIAARICGLAPVSTSCSSTTCCGLCDTSCAGSANGACITGSSGGVITCNTALSNCHATISLNPTTGCCQSLPAVGFCKPQDLPCRPSLCNATSGTCYQSPPCSTTKPCWTAACINGQCVESPAPLLTNVGSCDSQFCNTTTNSWQKVVNGGQAACVSNNRCLNLTCQTDSAGLNQCVPTASVDPSPAVDKCSERFCDASNGWGTRSIASSCGNVTCTATTCDPLTGCKQVYTNCIRDPDNLCEITVCDPQTGACPASPVYKTCTLPEKTCFTTAACNPGTGECELTGNKVCPDPNECFPQCVDGECVEDPEECTPTPTPTPTPGQTPTPTPSPTPTPPDVVCPLDCVKTPCFARECLPTGLCAEPVAKDCSYLLPEGPHECTSVACSETAATPGCYVKRKTSAECLAETAHGPCETVVADEDFPGCCKVIPKSCKSISGPCYTSACNATTGDCQDTLACVLPPENKCQVSTCTASGCVVSQKCKSGVESDTGCISRGCNATTGVCSADVFVGCNDDIPCTIDTCVNNNGKFECKYEHVCGNTSGPIDACSRRECEVNATTQQPSCVTKVSKCNASAGCVAAGCDPQAGCYSRKQQSLCPTDACSTSVCHDNGTCTSTKRNCTHELLANLTFCTEAYCTFQGKCALREVDCEDRGVVARNGSCEIVTCENMPKRGDPRAGACTKEGDECYNLSALIGGLTGGAIAGIVVAAVIAAGLISGGSVAAASVVRDDEDRVVHNNPLHEPPGNAGKNPFN